MLFRSDPARRAIGSYLASLPDPYRHPPEDDPPPPLLRPLEDAGVSLEPPEAIDAALEEARPRRARMFTVLTHQGWPWDDALHHRFAR